MPHWWLSTRGREENCDVDSNKIPRHEFDFAFTNDQTLMEYSETRDVDVLRPATSAEYHSRSRRKPDLTLLTERPRSSDSAYIRTPLSARFDASKIGLALGSPRYPPQDFVSMPSTICPQSQRSSSCNRDSTSPPASKAKKWKISPFFRQKSEAPCQLQAHPPNNDKICLPIQRIPWRDQKSPPMPQEQFLDETPPPPPEKDAPRASLVYMNQSLVRRFDDRTSVMPTIKVNIPVMPLDRYSATKSVGDPRQSELLARRTRELEQLTVLDVMKSANEELRAPRLQRRVTSPTTRTHRESRPDTLSNACSQKYSLFPTKPTSMRSQSLGASSRACRRRSATAPVSSVPEISERYVAKQETKRQAGSPSSHAKARSTGLTQPLTTCTDADSQGSASSEIFFDVKSLRDSNGQIGQQFEVTRPPAAAVQLVRSRSSARKLSKQESSEQNHAASSNDVTTAAHQSVTAQIDGNIRTVKKSISESALAPNQLEITTRLEAQTHLQTLDIAGSTVEKLSRKDPFKSRLDCLNLGVPSPVLEATEETTSQEVDLARRESPEMREVLPPKPVLDEVPYPPPCAVSAPRVKPIRDAHNIPLSKYAPKHTTEELVHQIGLRPVRPARANTESSIWRNLEVPSSRRAGGPFRSATLPLPDHIPHSRYATVPSAVPRSISCDDDRKNVSIVLAYVRPAAEVSIARTVSLSRRPSVKVTVARHQHTSEPSQEPSQVIGKQVSLGVPVVQEVHNKHKHGQSLNIVLKAAAITPSLCQAYIRST